MGLGVGPDEKIFTPTDERGFFPHFPTSPLPHFPTSPLPHFPNPLSPIPFKQDLVLASINISDCVVKFG
ncbi:MAG: hypothetical protein EWV84_15620 [Microcystis sp. M_QC_C_20170808_M3Col]|nr:MAG: hypothetical protein EWV84_15620 [Microcystis sp. M_QC_C_20170808_M3Col]